MNKLRVASLFSGVGTPEQSLKHLGIEHKTVFACEIDKYARITYLENNQEPNTFYEDVYNIDGNKYKNQIDILIGGSPCQSFSIAGKRMGTECPRGNLIYEYFRIVEESQPKVFIYENVKGFLSIDKGETFKNFVQSFKDIGYITYHQVLNTKDYGVPQNRERIYIVGFRENIDFEFAPKQELKLRLKDMLEDSVNEKYYLNKTNINFMNTTWGKDTRWRKMKNPINGCAGTICATHSRGLPRGVIINNQEIQDYIYANGLIEVDEEVRVIEAVKKGYTVANEGDSINISVPSSKTRRGRVGKQVAQTLDTACNQVIFEVNSCALRGRYNEDGSTSQRLEFRKDEVSNSITTVQKDSYVKQNYIFRKLTPRECFRLQGFDDSFVFPEKMSDTQLYKQAGNGMSRNILDMIFTQVLVSYTKHIENILKTIDK